MVLQTNHAANYANQLLTSLGFSGSVTTQMDHPSIAWYRSAMQGVTGSAFALPLASHADGALMALKAISLKADRLPMSGSQLLGERARLRDIKCKGQLTAGGQGQLLKTRDGHIALNLVREDDWDLIAAWLEENATTWQEIELKLLEKTSGYWVERGVEIGLAIALEALPARPKKWFSKQTFKSKKIRNPIIVDLSSLWAAPLASSLLSMTGAHIIKIESPNRPDGMRYGHKGFYELINAGKDCVALDFNNADDLNKLKTLLDKADGVIEASRPRALKQLNIVAEEFVARKPGKVWARLTAYGRDNNRIGFGDDIGVSAGLSTVLFQTDNRLGFVGDAIADPINGLHLALAMQSSFNQGDGAVIDMSMHHVLRYAMGDISGNLNRQVEQCVSVTDNKDLPLYPLRNPAGKVKSVGEDNKRWLC